MVAVHWAGICGSDLHEYQEGPVFIPVDKADELTGGHAPLTMGHEFSGVAGATKIVVVDLSAVRLEKALQMGATDVINAGETDAVEAVHAILPEGADVVFEVAGVQKTFEQAIDSTRPRGTMVVVSIFAHAISFDPMQLINAGIHITSSIAYSRESFQ